MRRFGIEPATAAEQLQRDQATGAHEPFQPLPTPPGAAPYRLKLADVHPLLSAQTRTFHVIGDTGGIKDPNPQLAVAKAMAADLPNGVEFGYHVGDISYFNGAEAEYGPQFYEPYAHYNVPILGVPGNHDGDAEPGSGESSLQAFIANLCTASPTLPSKWAEFNRDTMTQPNVYFTLEDELVTVVGLYSNVPSGGVIKQDQIDWLVGELKAAPTDRALIVSLHHPPLSCDAHHGGSAAMGKILDEAFMAAGRWPHLVLSGHVHNYQRFTRTLHAGHDCIYVVTGASGYHNRHGMASDAVVGMEPAPGVKLEAFEDKQWGFLRLTVNKAEISGTYTAVSLDEVAPATVDTFTIPLLG